MKESFWNIHNDLSLVAVGTLVFSSLFQEGDDFGPNKGKIAHSYFY